MFTSVSLFDRPGLIKTVDKRRRISGTVSNPYCMSPSDFKALYPLIVSSWMYCPFLFLARCSIDDTKHGELKRYNKNDGTENLKIWKSEKKDESVMFVCAQAYVRVRACMRECVIVVVLPFFSFSCTLKRFQFL